jgi:hypothetical protein
MTDRPASWRMPPPKQMKKRGRPLRLRMGPFPPNIKIRAAKISMDDKDQLARLLSSHVLAFA